MDLQKIQLIQTKSYLTKSKLPESDYVINPYVGCTHGCKYCYAEFMKRFTGHTENWGEFLDVKLCNNKIDDKKINGKTIFLSSVTDCYNPFEKKYEITRKILKELIDIDCIVHISTKSKLILRDIDILKRLPNLKVAISLNTLDENFRKDMDRASSINERMDTLRELHKNGIYTVLFMSPIFPKITEWKPIVQTTNNFVDEYWFENLNLRGSYKNRIFNYIKENYGQYYDLYKEIYIDHNKEYWEKLADDITSYCDEKDIRYKNYFEHKKLVEEKQGRV